MSSFDEELKKSIQGSKDKAEIAQNVQDEEELIARDEDEARMHYSELQQLQATESEKILIVNNYSRFASVDVWAGICGAFRDLGHQTLNYSIHNMRAFLSQDMMEHHIVSTVLSTKNNFTHVLFVGSTFLHDHVPLTLRKCGVKVAYWSLEDPHALDQNYRFMELVDYYFTNERRVAKEFPQKAIYLPTAGDHHACMPSNRDNTEIPDWMFNDIVFCGNVYPNRQELLEKIIPLVDKKGYKFSIVGVTSFMKDKNKSPLKKHILGEYEGVVDHRWLVMFYGLSKLVINIEREDSWEYDERFSTNRKFKMTGESLNPRAYEIPLCAGGLQLIDNKREEVYDDRVLRDKEHFVIYKDADDLCQKTEYYLEHEEERKKIVEAARKHAFDNHTYIARAYRMRKVFRLKEGKREQVAKDELGTILNRKKEIKKEK